MRWNLLVKLKLRRVIDMTIDEAIEKARNNAVIQRNNQKLNYMLGKSSPYYNLNCDKYAEYHEQIAEWLEELKEYKQKPEGWMWDEAERKGYNKAIDDFVEAIDRADREEPLILDMYEIEQMAELLKAGGKDD